MESELLEPKHADAVSALGLCGGLPGWRSTETYPGSETLNWWFLGLQREVVQAEVDTATEFYVDSYLEDIYMPIMHKGVFSVRGDTRVIGWLQTGPQQTDSIAECLANALFELCWYFDRMIAESSESSE